MRVHIEVAAPSIMGFTMVGLLTDAPVLALYAPTDPMNSLLPLWTLSANYKSVYVPFDLKRSDREEARPSSLRARQQRCATTCSACFSRHLSTASSRR